MKILILEDNKAKLDEIKSQITNHDTTISIDITENYCDFLQAINRQKYNLIIIDLVIPQFQSNADEKNDMSTHIIEALRDISCPNIFTPAFCLTEYEEKAEDHFAALNACDIVVVTYQMTSSQWKDLLKKKIIDCTPKKTYDAVIICALAKEAEAFATAGFSVGDSFIHNNLSCTEIDINGYSGLIVTLPKMGLVNAAICSALAIEFFSPKIICMSGICAGIVGKTNIYDVIIPDICHQHDFGKWTEDGFKYEPSHIQIDHHLKINIEHLINSLEFQGKLMQGITLSRPEFPEGMNEIRPKCFVAAASSGNAVVAASDILSNIASQGRKQSAFEMESFALYEAARTSMCKPLFFSAKSVVDNGNAQKSDDFHRIACILSAKVTFEILKKELSK